MMRIDLRSATSIVAILAVTSCDTLGDALTAHSRAAAESAGFELASDELGSVLAASPMPDSTLTGYWAGQLARLWTDYVALAVVYQHPDTTSSLDYTALLAAQRHYAALSVARFRDSIVLRDLEPSEDEMREYYETRHPLTRLDVRRIVISVPPGADEATRDSLFAVAEEIRAGLLGGADFVAVARARSDEPPEARGQTLSYQGHDDFPPEADSIVFRLTPGEVSPVFATDDGILIYTVERRRTPEFERARELVQTRMVGERRAERSRLVFDSLEERARPTVSEGAVEVAREVVTDRTFGVGKIRDSRALVRWEGGEFTVSDLRQLFRVRADIAAMFAGGSDEEVHEYLLELARDELLVAAAARAGAETTEAERRNLSRLMGTQLAAIAGELGLSHALVSHPAFDLDVEGIAFLRRALHRSEPLPWAGSFSLILDREFERRVDDRGAEAAARLAREIRESARSRSPAAEGTPGEIAPDESAGMPDGEPNHPEAGEAAEPEEQVQ